MISGFIVGFFMQKVGRIKSFYRVLFFAPQVTSSVAVAAIWLWLFNPDISPLNRMLRPDRDHPAGLAAEPEDRHPGVRDRVGLAGRWIPDRHVHGRLGERAQVADGGG